jgi:hypothetical protein
MSSGAYQAITLPLGSKATYVATTGQLDTTGPKQPMVGASEELLAQGAGTGTGLDSTQALWPLAVRVRTR